MQILQPCGDLGTELPFAPKDSSPFGGLTQATFELLPGLTETTHCTASAGLGPPGLGPPLRSSQMLCLPSQTQEMRVRLRAQPPGGRTASQRAVKFPGCRPRHGPRREVAGSHPAPGLVQAGLWPRLSVALLSTGPRFTNRWSLFIQVHHGWEHLSQFSHEGLAFPFPGQTEAVPRPWCAHGLRHCRELQARERGPGAHICNSKGSTAR